jgi:hypothetical protein
MKKYLVLILLAVIVSSCQDEILNDSNPVIENVNVNLSMDEAMSIANDNPTNLSEDEILAMVNDFSSSYLTVDLGHIYYNKCHKKHTSLNNSIN